MFSLSSWDKPQEVLWSTAFDPPPSRHTTNTTQGGVEKARGSPQKIPSSQVCFFPTTAEWLGQEGRVYVGSRTELVNHII